MQKRVVLTNIALARVGSVLITCFATTAPTDAEVGKMIERFEVKDYQTLLFSARGPGPNAKQRARIAEYWKKSGQKAPRSSLLTESVAARLVGHVISMLVGAELKCFPVSEVAAGLAYLGHPAPVADVSDCIEELHRALEFKQRQAG